VPLRPLDANDILRGIFSTVRHYLRPLYLPLLAVVLGSTVLLGGSAYVAWALVIPRHLGGERMTTARVIDVAVAAAVVAVPALVCAAFAYAVTTAVSITVLGHHAVLGRRHLTARQAWTEARPHLWRTLGTQLLTVLVLLGVLLVSALPALVLGLALHSGTAAEFGLLLLVPGWVGLVYVGGRLFYAAPVTVLEGMRPTAAMRRSWQLDRGAWWRTLGIVLLPGLVGRAATEVITGGGSTVAARYLPPGLLNGAQNGQSLHLSAAGLVLPFFIVGLAVIAAAVIRAPLTPLTLGLLYIDRCIRKERLQATLIAAAGGAVSHAPFPLLPYPPLSPPPRQRRGQDAKTPADDQPPYGRQQPVKGRGMIGAGWVLRMAGTGVGLAGYVTFRQGAGNGADSFGGVETWLIRAAGFLASMVGVRVFAYGRLLVARGKRHTVKVIGSFAKLLYSRYVLYLRPFSNDKEMAALPTRFLGGGSGEAVFFLPGLTQEESLVRRFGGIGRVVAVGRPGEELPLPGATRGYLPLDDWQDVVSALIRSAHVVALAAGTGPGTVWEFTEAVRTLDLRRLVLLVYCNPAMYNEFRDAVRVTYDERRSPRAGELPAQGRRAWPALPELPDFPPVSRPRRTRREIFMHGGKKQAHWDFPLKGIVVFDREGQSTFIRFDPTAVRFSAPWILSRMVRRQFTPVISGLAALPHSWENGVDT